MRDHIQREQKYNEQLARLVCGAADLLERDITPEALQEFQDALRSELIAVEARLRVVRRRKDRRAARLGRANERSPQLTQKIADYVRLAQIREAVLINRRDLLKQCGDACAWLVLGGDPRLILPLFSASRTHNQSAGIGLAGPIQLMHQAHASGKFLVVDNDLTRCLGIGDLTVVRANGRWIRPLAVEVKTKGRLEKGAMVELDMITSHSDHPLDQSLFDDFSRWVQAKERVQPRITRRVERQSKEIQERADLLVRVTEGPKSVMPLAERSLWKAMENLLAKAQHVGRACDRVEEGVAFIAVRNRENDAAEAAMMHTLELLREIGLGPDQGCQPVSTEDLRTNDCLAPIAPPIPLWPIHRTIREQLLTGELFFACIIAPDVWKNAFERHGIRWREERGHWILERNGERGILDPIEVQKLTVGVALAGFSPEEVAVVVGQNL